MMVLYEQRQADDLRSAAEDERTQDTGIVVNQRQIAFRSDQIIVIQAGMLIIMDRSSE